MDDRDIRPGEVILYAFIVFGLFWCFGGNVATAKLLGLA